MESTETEYHSYINTDQYIPNATYKYLLIYLTTLFLDVATIWPMGQIHLVYSEGYFANSFFQERKKGGKRFIYI